jgi:isocitrate dehydrogenase
LYWANALAKQSKDAELAETFKKLAADLTANENRIITELNGSQGHAIDLGGHYHPNHGKITEAMRPSRTFNNALSQILVNA